MCMRYGVSDTRCARNKDQRTAGAPVCFDPWNSRIQTAAAFECNGLLKFDLGEIDCEQKCIHPIETADFCAVLYV